MSKERHGVDSSTHRFRRQVGQAAGALAATVLAAVALAPKHADAMRDQSGEIMAGAARDSISTVGCILTQMGVRTSPQAPDTLITTTNKNSKSYLFTAMRNYMGPDTVGVRVVRIDGEHTSSIGADAQVNPGSDVMQTKALASNLIARDARGASAMSVGVQDDTFTTGLVVGKSGEVVRTPLPSTTENSAENAADVRSASAAMLSLLTQELGAPQCDPALAPAMTGK